MKTRVALVALLVIVSLSSFAQKRQLGLIVLNNEELKINDPNLWGIFTAKEGFKVFDSPNGKEIGLLTREVKSNEFNAYSLYFIDVDKTIQMRIEIPMEETLPSFSSPYIEINVEEAYLTYFERKDGFVRVISKSVDYWIDITELEEKNFKVIDWQEFYIQWSEKVLEIYTETELKLQKQPSINAKTIKTLKGDLFEIYPMDESKGNWTKVKVKKYKIGVCKKEHENSLEYEVEGWIKVVTDSDEPNLNFSGSC